MFVNVRRILPEEKDTPALINIDNIVWMQPGKDNRIIVRMIDGMDLEIIGNYKELVDKLQATI